MNIKTPLWLSSLRKLQGFLERYTRNGDEDQIHISDYKLRKETKNFLLEKCTVSDVKLYNKTKILEKKPIDFKFVIDRNSRIYKSSVNNNMFLLNNKNNYEQKEKSFIKKTCSNKLNYPIINEALNSFHKLINKSDKSNNKLINSSSSNSFDLGIIKSNENKRLSRNSINESFNDNMNYSPLKKKSLRKSNDNNFYRRKKKLKDLDIISSNIQKTSQNLNQPEVFYAGLFNNLIKDYPKIKEVHNYFNKKKSVNSSTIDNHGIKEKDK